VTRRTLFALALPETPSRHVPLSVEAPEAGRAGPGWPTFELRPGEWVRLRLALATTERSKWTLEVRRAGTQAPVGEIVMWQAVYLQPHELLLDRAEDLEIRTRDLDKPIRFVKATTDAPALAPHLLVAGTRAPIEEFRARMNSWDCLTAFTWTEGCVMDGLLAMKNRAALDRHMELYFQGGAGPKIGGIEGTLPHGVLARLDPRHAGVDAALRLWEGLRDPQGCIQDGTLTSAEGCYTVAYPLAAIAAGRRDDALGREAIRQLTFRMDRLPEGDALHLRWDLRNGFTFRNWCRGAAWYLLGIARVLEALGVDADAVVRNELRVRAEWIAQRQLPSGLWSTYVDDPAVAPDTSGSAGIAAALAMGVRLGVLPESFREVARRTFAGCVAALTPDGLLAGGSQSNSGGEVLQRSDYRVIHQFGMGLLGQLMAELGR
jgi:hypothetical protein